MSKLVLSSMNTFKQQPIHWLWDQRFALGKLAILAGDPGLGKSFLTMDLAARVSRDGIMPDGFEGPGGDVVLMSAEDDPADTLLPRLRAAQATLSRIHFVRGIRRGASVRGIDLTHLDALEEMFRSVSPRLLVIDPISAFLGETDSNNNSQVRGLLAPLAQLASQHRCCVLAVSHLNKSGDAGSGKAIYRTMGSLAFVAAARSAWLVTRDRSLPHLRLMSQIKNNLGIDRKGIRYQIIDGAIAWDPTEIDLTADDAMDETVLLPGRPDEARETAADLLRRELADGSARAGTLYAVATRKSISPSTLKRAARELGVIMSGPARSSVWSLPTASE